MAKEQAFELMIKLLVGGVDKKTFDILQSICFITKKKKGEVLFFEKTKGNNIYFLVDGKIKLFRSDERGSECVIHFVNKHEFFAEILLTQDFYPVSAITLCESILIGIDKNKLLSIIKSQPTFALNIIVMFADRINYLVDKLERLSIQDAKQRFLNYLNYLKNTQNSSTVVIELPKQEIALLLGMAKETFSRIEKQLVNEDIIEVDNRKIRLLKNILP